LTLDHTTQIAVLIVVAVIAIAVIIFAVSRKRRSETLKQHFGPEYERAVLERGDTARAEKELINREKRVHSFTIKPLTPIARERFREEWSQIQNRFVDDPAVAASQADSLVSRVMAARGYPMTDFEQRAADVSVSYPAVVQNYRAACGLVQRYGRGDAGTEELRQAMVHYRSLFDELLGPTTFVDNRRGVLHERAS
jgi:FtsZ-interacting cell division protein ZipA